MEKIISGVARFQREVFPQRKRLFERLVLGQRPRALFLTCSDSRIDPNLLTQTDPGELFICRNAGNIVPPHTEATGGMTASIEYAVSALEVRHAIVCGHIGCGAMQAAMNPESTARLRHVRQWLTFCEAAVRSVEENRPELSPRERLDAVVDQNVLLQLKHLQTHPSVASRLAGGKLQIHGWVYNIGTGEVRAYDAKAGGFRPLAALGATKDADLGGASSVLLQESNR